MTERLSMTAHTLVESGKGILAADESFSTIAKRFQMIDLPSTDENRRRYREMLFTTPGLEKCISGVIMFDETIRQHDSQGTPFPVLLEQRGIIPGIKVDLGTAALAGFPDEKLTEGLDGLRNRLAEYAQLGARFTKWRAVFSIGAGLPSDVCIHANTGALANYAALSQEAGLVPIVEPEVLIDGEHSLERCEEVTIEVLVRLFVTLYRHLVVPEGILLKPNMVLPGKSAPQQASVEEVADATLRTLRHAVPAAVPGIVFLSGGQDAITATQHLNAMNRINDVPWQLSFSYGRALENPALLAWKGDDANRKAAQDALYHRAYCNSLARYGRYTPDAEKQPGQGRAAA